MILKKTFTGLLYQMIGLVFYLIVQLLMIKYMSMDDFGIFNYIFSIVSILAILFSFGMDSFLPSIANHRNEHERKQLFINITFSILLFFVFVSPLLYFVLQLFVDTKYIVVILVLSVLLILNYTTYAFYVAESKLYLANIVKYIFINVPLMIGLLVLTFLQLMSVTNVLWMYVAAYTIVTIYTILKNKVSFRLNMSVLFKGTIYFTLLQIITGTYLHILKIIQQLLNGSSDTAGLSVALIISNVVGLIGFSITKSVMVDFSKFYKESKWNELKSAFMASSRYYLYIMTPITIVLIALLKDLLQLLKPDYVPFANVIIIVLIAQFFSSVVGPNGTLLNMTNRAKYELYNNVIRIVFIFLFTWILSPITTDAVYIVYFISEVGINTIKYIQIKRFFGIVPYYFKDVILVFSTGIILYIFLLFRTNNIYIDIVLYGTIGLIMILAHFNYSMHQEDQVLIDRMKKLLKI